MALVLLPVLLSEPFKHATMLSFVLPHSAPAQAGWRACLMVLAEGFGVCAAHCEGSLKPGNEDSSCACVSSLDIVIRQLHSLLCTLDAHFLSLTRLCVLVDVQSAVSCVLTESSRLGFAGCGGLLCLGRCCG